VFGKSLDVLSGFYCSLENRNSSITAPFKVKIDRRVIGSIGGCLDDKGKEILGRLGDNYFNKKFKRHFRLLFLFVVVVVVVVLDCYQRHAQRKQNNII